jgi:hypothetical protein
MNPQKQFEDYIASFATQTEKLKYWISTVQDWKHHTNYRVSMHNLTHFRLTYLHIRLRDDPLFPDYDSHCFVPIAYMEASDYRAYADQVVFDSKKAEKDKMRKALEDEVRNEERQLKALTEKVEQKRKRLLEM